MIAKLARLIGRFILRPINIVRSKLDPSGFVRSLGVKVGSDVRFIGLEANGEQFGGEPYLIEIGDHVTITAKVLFINHDGGMWVFRKKEPNLNIFGRICIGNNCFIGVGAIILPGVEIGDDCVVGAGSIVTKSIPAGSVAAGIPAKIICTVEEYYQKNKLLMDSTQFQSNKAKKNYLLEKFKNE